jgi:guanylate cyclase
LGGTIQITRETYESIKEDFVCEPRGTVDVKGKGEMDVWLVVSAIRADQSARAEDQVGEGFFG